MSRLTIVLTFLAVIATAATATTATEIVVTGDANMPHVSVRARNVLPIELLTQIARETQRVLLLPEDLPLDDALSGVDLRDRPLDEVVEIIAGTAGLVARVRKDSITVSAETIAPEASDLRMRALAAHSWALLSHPARPEVIETRVAMARVHAQLDQVESAVEELSRARSMLEKTPLDTSDPRTASLLVTIPRLLGEYHARLENWPRVTRSLGQLALDEDCEPLVLLLLGRAYAALEEIRPARFHLARLISGTSSSYRSEAELLLGQLDRDAGEEETARQHFETAARCHDAKVGGTALLELAAMSERLGNGEQEANHLAFFTKRFPRDERAPGAALKLVDCLAGPLDSPLRAAHYLEKVLETYPDCMSSLEAAMRVARLYASAELTPAAVQRLEGEIELLAEDDPARAELLEELARILEGDLMPASTARARIVYRRLAVLPGRRQTAKLRAAHCLLRLAEQAPTPAEQRRELLACLAEIRVIPRDELPEEDRALRTEIEVKCHERLGNAEAARQAREDALR